MTLYESALLQYDGAIGGATRVGGRLALLQRCMITWVSAHALGSQVLVFGGVLWPIMHTIPDADSAVVCRHRKDAGGGYQRLRKLIVSMLGVHHSLRPNALQVAQQLNELLNDFRDMM